MLKLLLAAVVVSMTTPAEAPVVFTERPRLMHDNGKYAPLPLEDKYWSMEKITTPITFVRDANSKEGCNPQPGEGHYIACTYNADNRMVVPNPCQYTEESYARLLCHELAHVRGWPGDHPHSFQ